MVWNIISRYRKHVVLRCSLNHVALVHLNGKYSLSHNFVYLRVNSLYFHAFLLVIFEQSDIIVFQLLYVLLTLGQPLYYLLLCHGARHAYRLCLPQLGNFHLSLLQVVPQPLSFFRRLNGLVFFALRYLQLEYFVLLSYIFRNLACILQLRLQILYLSISVCDLLSDL